MATKRRTPPEPRPLPGVVRRRPEEKLPPQLTPEQEAFARGDDDALWRRERRGGRVNDPRAVALVPGVANRDARAVFDARVKRMRDAIAASDEATLAVELAEAARLRLHRANSVVTWESFVESVVGLSPERGAKLQAEGERVRGYPAAPLTDAEIAVWMRAESGVLEGSPDAHVHLIGDRLELSVPMERAPQALAGAGRRSAPMTRQEMGKETIVDRPRGVRPIAEIVERERRIREGE